MATKKKLNTDPETLKVLHRLMWEAQKRGGDFDLTFQEIATAWDYKSKSAPTLYLPILVKAGLVKAKTRGTRTVYRAVEKET